MKRECPSLLAALTVSVLVNVLLRSQSAYWPRAGALTALFCAPLLAVVGGLFAKGWNCGPFPVFLFFLVFLLV